MLELKPKRFLSCDYTALLDGAPLTTVIETVGGPLSGCFDVDGERWFVRPHLPAGGGLGLLRSIAGAVLGRQQHRLCRADGLPVALSERLGLRDGSHKVVVGNDEHMLAWLADAKTWEWRGCDGAPPTRVERISGTRCGVRIDFGRSVALPVQVFVGLIAMSAWETVSRGGGGE